MTLDPGGGCSQRQSDFSKELTGNANYFIDADLIHATRVEGARERLGVVNIHAGTALCFVINRAGSLSDESVEFRRLGAINRHNRYPERRGDMCRSAVVGNNQGRAFEERSQLSHA